jgi:hypothetical protein
MVVGVALAETDVDVRTLHPASREAQFCDRAFFRGFDTPVELRLLEGFEDAAEFGLPVEGAE